MLPDRERSDRAFTGTLNGKRLQEEIIQKKGTDPMFIAELLEAGMLICFGLSWPMNAYKSYKAKTALGTSWQFLALICAGYACGVAAKLTLGSLNWVLAVYILNCFFLAANWVVYFRNRKLDRMRQLQNAKNRNEQAALAQGKPDSLVLAQEASC